MSATSIPLNKVLNTMELRYEGPLTLVLALIKRNSTHYPAPDYAKTGKCLVGRLRPGESLNSFKQRYVKLKFKTMSKDIREMIDKVKNFKQFVNENINTNNIISFDLAKKLKDKKFHIPTDLFYTDKGIISNEFYKLEYQKGKVPRADWNAYPENPNAKPWYRYGYSAPTLEVVIQWMKKRFDVDVNNEFEILKALEIF